MGLKDKIKGTLRSMWSPITVWMAGEGSDELVTSGSPAKVLVSVLGEDDGTAERIDLVLELKGSLEAPKRTWPLGEVPAVVGTHELMVTIPSGLPPSCARYAEYFYDVTLHRTKGTGSSAGCKVDVISRPEDLAWPEGPRSGNEGDSDPALVLNLDADVVTAGDAITGRIVSGAAGSMTVTLGTRVSGQTAPNGTYREVVESRTQPDGTFALPVPAAAPPSLNTGSTSIFWQVRATHDGTTAWHWVGVLDPECAAGTRHQPPQGLLD